MVDFVPETEMPDLRELLQDLENYLDLGLELLDWQIDFIECLANWSGCFTESQADKLKEVYDEVF